MTDTSVADQGDPPETGDDTSSPSSAPASRQEPAQRTWQPPPGLPGPLQALVSQLQGRQVGPLPQPRVAPPFDRLQQAALQREAPFARPTGAFPPWRQSPVQTYVPALPTRSAAEWGSDGAYPNTPATWELPGIWQGVGNKLAEIGSGNVSPIARLLGGGNYMKSYVAGQAARVKLDHEAAVNNAWQLNERQTEELHAARDAFALFGGDVSTMTGADETGKLPNVGSLHDALSAIANKYGDEYLLAALNSGSGGLKRAENILKERDAASRDLRGSLAQQEKDAEKRRKEAPFRVEGGPSQAGPPIGDTPPPPGLHDGSVPTDQTPDPNEEAPPPASAEPGAPETPDTSAPEDTGEQTPENDISPYGPAQAQARAQPPRGVQVAQAGASDAPQPGIGQLAQAQPAPAQPAWQAAPSRVLPEAQQNGWRPDMVSKAAVSAVNDPMFKPNAKGEYPGYPADMTGYIMRRSQELEGELERIKRSNLSGPAAEAAIRSVDPQLADALVQYTRGNLPVPQNARFAAFAASTILPLGNKIDPSFNENTFKLRYQTKKNFTSGVEGRTLTSIATAKKHLESALAAMDHVPNYVASQVGDWRILSSIMPKSVTDEIGTLENSIHTGSNEYERALLGGKPSRGSITDTEKELDWRHTNPEVIKANLRNKIQALKARLDVLKGQFRAGFGRGDDDMYKIFDNWAASGKDSLDSADPERTLAAPGQIKDLQDLDRAAPNPRAPAPPAPGWKFEPVQ